MISNEDVSCSKPDPEIYLAAFSKLSFAPEECLILEDNENGIKAAKGMAARQLQIEVAVVATRVT